MTVTPDADRLELERTADRCIRDFFQLLEEDSWSGFPMSAGCCRNKKRSRDFLLLFAGTEIPMQII